MITIIGTGHIFRIADSVAFIIKNIWPDAILVELDERRLAALEGPAVSVSEIDKDTIKNLPVTYRKSAKYQEKMSKENNTQTGGELLAAINMSKIINARLVCIDKDAEQTMRDMENEMPFFERAKLSLSMVSDNLFGSRKVKSIQDRALREGTDYVADMRRRYPTFVRKLIDERDEHMAARINEEAQKYGNIVIVVGDAHVDGIVSRLNMSVNKIRLADLMDPVRLEKVKDAVWNNELGGRDGS